MSYLGRLEGPEEHTALMGATAYRLVYGIAAQTPDEAGMAGPTAHPKVVLCAKHAIGTRHRHSPSNDRTCRGLSEVRRGWLVDTPGGCKR